ncbi:hypothetical protein DY000_02042924 [Brassica cretica]|uniref:Uncharacterized protein n=1 Tax=Brassica cretica TaxID=69181 RepID=A0ABQ7BKU0_BRACR|nr:hypothetical protein DY000_02042924 [Brassica cretica]
MVQSVIESKDVYLVLRMRGSMARDGQLDVRSPHGELVWLNQLAVRLAGPGRASFSCGELNRLVRLVARRTGSVEPARSVADAVFAVFCLT